MGASSLDVAVVFHAMRGMYLHAERLLAKAGRQGAMRRGIAHPKGKRSAVIFRRKIMGRPLAPRQGRALSEVWFPYLRAAQELSGAALRAGTGPPRFSLACLGFSFRGVQRGCFSFQRERSEIMK